MTDLVRVLQCHKSSFFYRKIIIFQSKNHHFQQTNLHFLLKNLHFLLKDIHFVSKNLHFYIKFTCKPGQSFLVQVWFQGQNPTCGIKIDPQIYPGNHTII